MPVPSVLDPAVRSYLDALQDRVDVALGSQRCGIWLFGSAALGDFDAATSDLDVQAVSAERLPAARRRALAGALDHGALPCPVRGLEFVLYARPDLARADGPAFGLNLNTGPRMTPRLSLDARDDPRFWFVLDVAIGRQRGVPLAGPAPAAVFPPLQDALVGAALREALAWYAEAGDPTGTVLAACRAWAWGADGRWRSKGEAARWARLRLADPGPVDRALRARGGGGDGPDAAEALAVVRPALAAVAARAGAAPVA